MPQLTHAVGVMVWPAPSRNRPRPNQHGAYIHEILAHAGLCYSPLNPEEVPEALASLRVLVTVGSGEFAPEVLDLLRMWVRNGGHWLSLCDVNGAPELFGADLDTLASALQPYAPAHGRVLSLGEGYLAPATSHPVLDGIVIPLHYFNGAQVKARPGARVLAYALDAHGRATTPAPGRPLLVANQVEKGRCLLLAADAVGAVVHIQQGKPLAQDGSPSPDGLSPVADGVLKCDDGITLDWILDRQPVPGAEPLQGFLQPVADQWSELIVRAILYLGQCSGTTIPLLWLYPGDTPALAHMSHDSDGNNEEHAGILLDLLSEMQIRTTWCVICPGYSAQLMQHIADEGHELAVHYDAMDHPWSLDELQRQVNHLTELSGMTLVANKNHFTRWEGDTEFFSWCHHVGIQIESSKVGSKMGDLGFTFGSCQPYFPMDASGQLLEVLELPCLTTDLEVVAPVQVAEPLLHAVQRHHGVLHVLFHPAHTHKPQVKTALRQVVAMVHERGLPWWTATQINTWERARRTQRWTPLAAPEGTEPAGSILCNDAGLKEATLLVAGTGRIAVDGEAYPTRPLTFWGTRFQAITLDLEPGRSYKLTWETGSACAN